MQTKGSTEARLTAPVLLLGLGNFQMADDGLGQELLSMLSARAAELGETVEFLDGGTQGHALLGVLKGRRAVVFLDAVRLGHKPGAVHVLRGEELNDGRAGQILAALESRGATPQEVVLVGVEPEKIESGIGLSPAVRASLGMAAAFARMIINGLRQTEPQPEGSEAPALRLEKVLV